MTTGVLHAVDSHVTADPVGEPEECNGSPFCDCEACMEAQAELDAHYLQYLRRVIQ